MAIHIYKLGGAWKSKDGVAFTAKTIDRKAARKLLKEEWFETLEDAIAAKPMPAAPVPDSEGYKKDLRDKIKALGGVPNGNSSLARLEAQLKEFEDGDNN